MYTYTFIQDSPVSSEEETDGLNVTIDDSTDGGSLYVPTPQRIVRKNACIVRNVASNTVCFMDFNQIDKFIKQVKYAVVPHPVVKVH